MVSHPGREIDFSRCLNENVRAYGAVDHSSKVANH